MTETLTREEKIKCFISIGVGILAALIMLVALLCGGCHSPKVPPPSGYIPPPPIDPNFTGAQATIVSVYRTNWALSVALIGVTASVFAICMGLRKIGAAGLAASFTMAAMSIAMIRFSWVFGIGGLLIGIGTGLAALVKNRETIVGFVTGFQEVKDTILPYDRGTDREGANEIMTDHLTPEAKRIVAKVKG